MNFVAVRGRGYVPMDVLDQLPRVRILRALRRLGHVPMAEVIAALEIYDTSTAYRFQIHIRNLVREGLVTSTGKHGSMLYSANESGAMYLERLYRRAFEEA